MALRSISPVLARHSALSSRCSASISAASTAFVSVLPTTRPIERTQLWFNILRRRCLPKLLRCHCGTDVSGSMVTFGWLMYRRRAMELEVCHRTPKVYTGCRWLPVSRFGCPRIMGW